MHAPVMVSMALVGTMALVACGSERATEAVTERAVVATYAAAENTPDLEVFTVDISGDSAVEMPPGQIEYRAIGEMSVGGEPIPAHRLLELSSEDVEHNYVLTLMFASDLEAGEHPITGGAFDMMLAPVAAEFTDAPLGEGIESADALQFNNSVEGTLTLDQAGDTISGHFEFTAQATRMVDGVETVLSITAAGTFEDVELVDDVESTTEAPTAEASDTPTDDAPTEDAG